MNNKIPSVIRWTRSDTAKLFHAVRQFNQTIQRLDSLERNILPESLDYKDVKEEIFSRKELNRVLKSLKRFSRASQQKVVSLESGEQVTQWELSELKKSQKRAVETITDKAREIVESDTNVIGDTEYKQLMRTKESIQDLFNRQGYEFDRTKRRTMSWGRSDYDLWRADIYRQNFMKALKEMSTYDNYKLLLNKLKKIENPIKFFEYVQQSQTLADLFYFYKDKATSQTYGGFTSNQEAFDKAIFDDLKIERPKSK